MASTDYEIDAEGNLVQKGASSEEGDEQTVTPEQARRFLLALALSDLLSVGVMALAAYFVFPDKPVAIVAAAIVWAIFSGGVWLYMRNNIRRRIKHPA
jgi:hypothetical protein